MNGSKSPDPPKSEAGQTGSKDGSPNGRRGSEASARRVKSSPARNRRSTNEGNDGNGDFAAKSSDGPNQATVTAAGDDNGADSEAETLIDSPVKKKKEAEKQGHTMKSERPPKHRIGSLPVPTDNDDENDSAAVSPAPSTEMSMDKATSGDEMKVDDDESNQGNQSDSLSSPRSSNAPSRAASERPDFSRDGLQSPNPRKRKHRASSVSLPNKRPSFDGPKRRLRGLNSEEAAGRSEHSPSPKLRSHRRAVSTQSAFMDGTGEIPSSKRRAATQGLKDSKSSRTTWEESDASSETTSHGQPEGRRPRRGIGRSTSTPGRPGGREAKRHVNKYGFTKFAEACEDGDLDLVKDLRAKDPEIMEIAEFAGNKPLQIAALNGNVEVVDYLIEQGCQIDCANVDKDTPLIDAAENGHLDVVNSLLKAGVDPLRQNYKGQQALDVVTDDTDDAEEIRAALRRAIEEWNSSGAKQRREEEEESRHRAGPAKELHFMARTYENLLKLVQNTDRTGVREFLDARVPVDNVVIAAAAKTGDSYLVNMLLVELPEKKKGQKPERPLLSVLGSSHWEMVKSLTELENFNPLYRNRQGKTWPEIAEERHGPNWRQEQELLQLLYDQRASQKDRRSSSPVTKRDSAKRRPMQRAQDEEDEDSDEEQAPRRKNGRKLMSRRELRAAKGKQESDSSSDESSSEMATGAEEAQEGSMKPPQSPATKRTPTRSRTKSLSAQPVESSPRTRRASLRGNSEQPLPTLPEKKEEPENNDASATRSEQERERAAEAEAEANRVAAQREEEARAEAEAAAKRAAEEKARKEEEERKAEEARQEEEERKAAEARRAEEEQKRIAQEMEEAKRRHRDHIVSSLPEAFCQVLNPESGFDYDFEARSHIVHHFTPLQVVKLDEPSPVHQAASADNNAWVTNIQAAPLIGKHGIELMLRSDIPGYEGSLADVWDTRDVYTDEIPLIESILTSLPPLASVDPSSADDEDYSNLSFDQELTRIAGRINATADAKQKLRAGEAVLRYVRLDDVLKNLHPTLREIPIEVRFDYADGLSQPKGAKEDHCFVDKLGIMMAERPRPKMYLAGEMRTVEEATVVGSTTQVTIMHSK